MEEPGEVLKLLKIRGCITTFYSSIKSEEPDLRNSSSTYQTIGNNVNFNSKFLQASFLGFRNVL